MYKVNDLAKVTGLKEPFIRRCLRELKDIFEPHIERGAKNSLVLSSSIIPIFDKIKQDKANGLSLPAIKNLLSNNVIISKQIEKDLDKKLSNAACNNSNGDEWLSIKDAAKLSKKAETTIKRVIVSEFKHDHSRLKKDNSSKRGKWLISKKFLLDHFDIKPGHDLDHDIDYNVEQDKSNMGHDIVYNQGQDVNHQESQVVELLEKQIAELKEQLNKKDDQLKQKEEQLENLLSQKDQQIHQLHVLLKESKTSTIDYKPDENLGVFSKVLVKFGL